MKKILSLSLIITLLMSGLLILTGCEKEKEEKQEELDYANMTADDLLSHIADKENVSAEEYAWLISTYSYVKIKDDFTLEDNITDEALEQIESDAKPSLDSYLEKLLTSDAPQVRGYGISLITSLFGVSDRNMELAKNLIKDEKDPYVLYQAIRSLRNEAKESEEVASFLLKMAENENAKIRVQVAYALGNSWSKGVEGAVDTIIKLMNDEDTDVRKAACSSAGELGDEAVIDPLVAILNNDADADIHSSCIDGIVDLWYDFPFFEEKSEKAYNATMDYLKKTPRTEKIPNWMAVGSFKTTSNQDSFKKWKEEATYFNTDEVYNVMVDILKDGNANWLGRTAAIDVIKAHCSEEQFTSLKEIVDGLTDSKASLIQSSYENKTK